MRKKTVLYITALVMVIGGAFWLTQNQAKTKLTFLDRPVEANPEEYTNRLINEKSPYLLQHAHNPVDWYPWGDEAFEKAKKENKPVFISVGYSTCHWCHVMEEESFSNPEIAKIMNDNFVSIKVDREERPDVDNYYMSAVQAMTGSGGWPMSVFLTPEGKPFYGGTYFPPDDRWGRPGFATILNTMADKWKNDRENLLESAQDMSSRLQALVSRSTSSKTKISEEILEKGFRSFVTQFDSRYGGFGVPKFPRSHTLSFLLRYWQRVKDAKALEMVEKTLQAMARGGIYDHIGGGFHRYSTDAKWRVPHFEKMLYDQAIIAKAYLEAYQVTGNESYADMARDIFDYVLRDMTDVQGGFYSAEDADSSVVLDDNKVAAKKREGAFYVWSKDEIKKYLEPVKAKIFSYHYGVESGGNVARDPFGEFKKKNILYVVSNVEKTALEFKKSQKEIQSILEESKAILFDIRAKRPRPYLDDKVLTDWNGLMISSLAYGARVLENKRYEIAARKAADFILKEMKRSDGRLLHRWREGDAGIPGFLEDYAFFTNGLYDLYEATFDTRYLKEAKYLSEEMIRLFADKTSGGFYFTSHDTKENFGRTKEIYDGATPSGNSVAALALLRVGRLTVSQNLEDQAYKTLEAFSGSLAQSPS
ncbi:thioredoxin domain-containing protein, partial [PVC group bacterium]|nr:thioredoxin domain-containing protein [PVC group bacterium]